MSFGIAGIALALGALILPIGFNLVTSWIALACAAVALASRERLALVLGGSAWLMTVLNLVFVNAQARYALFGAMAIYDPAATQVATTALYITLAAFLAPLLALLARGGAAIAKPNTRKPDHTHADAVPNTDKPDDALAASAIGRLAKPIEIVSASAPSRIDVSEIALPEIVLPSGQLLSAAMRLLLIFGLAFGAAGVVMLLRALEA